MAHDEHIGCMNSTSSPGRSRFALAHRRSLHRHVDDIRAERFRATSKEVARPRRILEEAVISAGRRATARFLSACRSLDIASADRGHGLMSSGGKPLDARR